MSNEEKEFIIPSVSFDPRSIEDVLHDVIAGLTGIENELVRPRWQPNPPKTPDLTVDWCAFGITQQEVMNCPEIRHHSENGGYDEIVVYRDIRVLVSFYGDSNAIHAEKLRHGLQLSRNRLSLRGVGLAFVEAGSPIFLPEQVSLGWLNRTDISLVFRLETKSTYESLNLLQTQGSITMQVSRSTSSNEQEGNKEPALIEIKTGCDACSRDCPRG